jgi:hypothetical protein
MTTKNYEELVISIIGGDEKKFEELIEDYDQKEINNNVSIFIKYFQIIINRK